jgi:eukaryotic-like serine/threonine-protein kinase
VKIFDSGFHKGQAYLIMELLDGESLAGRLERGPLPADQAVDIARQIASVLDSTHRQGVIHRDLKPDNIHIGPKDVVKILDFGVAKMAGAGRLTRTGMVFGTPHYMSPEQASGGVVDHRADIYALGIIMYEMFTGRVPFEADSYMGVLTKHMYMLPEPPSRVHPAARELGALEDVTLRCLEKKPEARYASMEELIQEIESLVQVREDGLDIRPSRLSKKPRAPVLNLADDLEPPGRDELNALRPAGVPGRGVGAVIAIGAAVGALLAIALVYAVTRTPNSPAGVALIAPAVSAVAEENRAGPPAAAPTPIATSPTPVVCPPTTSDKAAVVSRPRPENKPRGADHAARPPASAAARPSFGGGEIINPWAK